MKSATDFFKLPTTSIMLPKNLVFVDVETTGASLRADRVIEVGLVRVEDGSVVKTFSQVLNPNCFVPQEILNLTGIAPAEIEAAPTFRQVKDELIELFDDAMMVAHNARFDWGFLQTEFKNVGLKFAPKHFCTVKLSRKLFPEHRHHNLDSIMERFQIECPRRHRAFDDAKVLWDFYQKLLALFPTEKLFEVINNLSNRPTIPVNIDPAILKSLPQSPGVYIFYGSNGVPLYVGKSINIKKRVLSHFSADHISSSEMKITQTIESIDTIVTAGELGALLKESDLVKRLQPLYNRKLRHAYKMNLLKRTLNNQGYLIADSVIADEISLEDIENLLGTFRSKKQIQQFLQQLVKEYELCDKLLGLEKTPKGCFGFSLGRCKGACVGEENPALYNARFETAFSKFKIKPWPFSKPIMIKEFDFEQDREEGYLIDKWCYLGKAKTESDLQDGVEKDLKFDLDLYKIIERHLRSRKNLRNIVQVNLN